MKVDYDGRLHAVYRAGRRMSREALKTWIDVFTRHVPDTRPLVWVDLGSGTGRMTPSLAAAFGGPVYGVEPSDKMRAQALADAGHTAVSYLAGSAEHIPLPDASCDAALVFFVWHHVDDHDVAARELFRIVKPGGKIFVVTNFSDAMPDVWWFRVVPEWMEVDKAQFRSQEEVKSEVISAGWTFVAGEEVTWLRAASLAEDYERLKLRSVSMFELMEENLVRSGFAKIEAALPSLDDGPRYETSVLLVFER